MANNDPIKDYNPLNLKLDRLKEKMEMHLEKDDPITDLHDCSNDLSDTGSRREEYEHSKFAEKIRNQNKVKYNNLNNSNYSKTQNEQANNAHSILVVIFLAILVFYNMEFIIELIPEFINIINENYYTEETEDIEEIEYTENIGISSEEFLSYKKNIVVKTLTTTKNETYIHLYNLNDSSFSDLKIKTIFYDENGNILTTTNTYVNMIIGKNSHVLKIIDAPLEYATCKHDIINEYGEYSSITKNDVVLKLTKSSEDYVSDSIILTNNTSEVIDYVEVVVAYIKDNKLLKLEEYNFFNLKYGEIQEKILRSNEFTEDEINLTIVTVNDVNIY